jgi:hypothetical protein
MKYQIRNIIRYEFTHQVLRKKAVSSINKSQNQLLFQYIKNVSNMHKQTANEYYDRILIFGRFVSTLYSVDLDTFIEELRNGNKKFGDVYDVLRNYSSYLIER